MAREFFKTALFTILFAYLLFAIYALAEKIREKEVLQQQVQLLPVDKIRLPDSTLFVYPKKKGLALIYFHATCGHCREMLKQISDQATRFRKIHLLFVSADGIADIPSISRQTGLSDCKNVSFGKIHPDEVYDTFASLSAPHIFIYNQDGCLVKEFKGTTRVEAMAEGM